MSTIIFYTLSLSAMAVVIYIGARSIMKGFNAKNDNKIEKQEEHQNEYRDVQQFDSYGWGGQW